MLRRPFSSTRNGGLRRPSPVSPARSSLQRPQAGPAARSRLMRPRPIPYARSAPAPRFTAGLRQRGYLPTQRFVRQASRYRTRQGQPVNPSGFDRSFRHRPGQPFFGRRSGLWVRSISGMPVLYRRCLNTIVLIAIIPRAVYANDDRSAEASQHGALYRRQRQIFLRSLLADPGQPRFVKGWIAQELRRLLNVQRALAFGYRPPGGSRYLLRGVPGFDTGHLPQNRTNDWRLFRLENAATNRARPGISRRLGLFNRFRES